MAREGAFLWGLLVSNPYVLLMMAKENHCIACLEEPMYSVGPPSGLEMTRIIERLTYLDHASMMCCGAKYSERLRDGLDPIRPEWGVDNGSFEIPVLVYTMFWLSFCVLPTTMSRVFFKGYVRLEKRVDLLEYG